MIRALDLLNELADRLGKPQFTTLEASELLPEHRKLLRLLNRVVRSAGAYNDWPILRKEGSIALVEALKGDATNSEFVTATKNSDTITIANVTLTETLIGQAFNVVGDEYIYKITDVLSPTSLKLDRVWANASITVSDEKVFTIAMDRYSLPSDFGRPVDDWQNVFAPYNILPATPNEFRELRRQEIGIRLADPERYTLFDVTETGSQIVHFHPWPENARILRFDYQRTHPEIDSDQDLILYPHTYIEVLIDICIQIASRDYDNDPVKAQQSMVDMLRKHNIQQSNPGVTDSRPRLEPSGITRQQVYESFGLPSVEVDWGSLWDTGRIFGL